MAIEKLSLEGFIKLCHQALTLSHSKQQNRNKWGWTLMVV